METNRNIKHKYDSWKNKCDVEERDEDDFTEVRIDFEGILTEDQYNDLSMELHDLFEKYKLYYTGI